jgi:hypothetical protein
MQIAGFALHNEPAFGKSFRTSGPHQERDVTARSQKPRAEISA